MSDHDHGPTAQLVDEVYCVTCQHWHIGTIPVTTFRCHACGFGCWGESVAVAHAGTRPDHIVHAVQHRVAAPSQPEQENYEGPRRPEAFKFEPRRPWRFEDDTCPHGLHFGGFYCEDCQP